MSKKLTVSELLEIANKHYEERAKWTYCHGALGQKAETNKIQSLYVYFQTIGKNKTGIPYETWKEEHRGQQCTDCSNWFNYIFDFGCSAWSSGSPQKWEQIEKAIPGCACWKDGHVGLCIAIDKDGKAVYQHMPTYERTFERFTEGEDKWHTNYWEGFAKFPAEFVDYTDPSKRKIYRVQVGSFYSRTKAENYMNELMDKGYPAYIVETEE